VIANAPGKPGPLAMGNVKHALSSAFHITENFVLYVLGNRGQPAVT